MQKNNEFEKALIDLMDILGYNRIPQNKKTCTNKNCDCEKAKSVKDLYNDYVEKKNNSTSSYKGFKMENINGENDETTGVKLTYIVPGVDKSELNISFDDNTCNVTCEKEIMYFGKLDSKVRMKFDVDYTKTTAKLEFGVLEISLYRAKPVSKVHKIKID